MDSVCVCVCVYVCVSVFVCFLYVRNNVHLPYCSTSFDLKKCYAREQGRRPFVAIKPSRRKAVQYPWSFINQSAGRQKVIKASMSR